MLISKNKTRRLVTRYGLRLSHGHSTHPLDSNIEDVCSEIVEEVESYLPIVIIRAV